MIKIDWHQLEKNSGAKEVSFEKFNYQIAVMKYSQFGRFESYYNTPGSEFYLILTKDCEELFAHAGDVIGWQAKFWLNKSAEENSPLDSKHRDELLEGFKTSLTYKPALKVWIICTPGLFSNTKPSCPVDQLEQDLRAIKPDVSIVYWNKPNYESIFHSTPEKFASIFNLYFSSNYFGYRLFHQHSIKRLDLLRNRYDTDLYTPGKEDKTVLNSILYEDKLANLYDQLKHALEDREKIINSTFYRVSINEFLSLSNTSRDTKKAAKVKSLLDNLLNLLDKLSVYKEQENTIPFLKDLYSLIGSQGKALNILISEAGLNNLPHYGDYIDDYNPDVKDTSEFMNYIIVVSGGFVEKIVSIYESLSVITQQIYHIFAEAGFGKTNLACSLTEKLLSKNLPVLLIPASEIRGGGPIEKQILNFLNIDSSLSFKDFIGVLDGLGFLHKIKIPIIIDGLNETQPSAASWYPTLAYIAEDIINYANVTLITTCRNAYAKQVFGENSPEDVSCSVIINGFRENVEEAIRKYFKKYDISPSNKDFNRDLFRNPLMLRIFCIANKGKTTEITESNIYVAIDSYINEIVTKIASESGLINPLTKREVLRGMQAYCTSLWKEDRTGAIYPDEVVGYFDPGGPVEKPWQQTITYKIVDEGLLFRNIHADKEYAEFTHDLIGGFCIAKYVILYSNNRNEILTDLQSDDLLRKLCSDNKHPLAEDIVKALMFLCPNYTGKELFQVTENPEIARACIRSLGITLSRTGGARAVIDHFKTIQLNHPHTPLLLESVLNEIIKEKERLGLVELIAAILLRCGPGQIDTLWSEIVRHRSAEVLDFLSQEIELFETGSNQGFEEQTLLLSALFLSSTNRLLRDTATKALVTIGKKYPQQLWNVLLSLEEVQDLYILDRLFAAVCGTFLQSKNEMTFLADVCQYLENKYFKQVRTSHVYILDYIDTLLRYAEVTCAYKRTAGRPPPEQSLKWQKDQECMQEIKDDHAAEWGFGPVDYEFAKYKIGSYLSKGWDKDSPLPHLTEVLAQVVYRAKELGYSNERFESTDITMNKERSEYRGANVQNYGKKYSKMAFYELYGSFLIQEVLLDFRGHDGYRIEVTDIDPTFPRLPRKHQVVMKSFLPSSIDLVQQWIVRKETLLLENHCFKSEDMRTEGMDWTMLYGRLTQQGVGKSRIDIGLYSILVPESERDKLSQKIIRNEISIRRFVNQSSYAMAGEIPWSDNFVDEETTLDLDGAEIKAYFPVTAYLRESKSGLKMAHDVKIPSKKILQGLDLRINLSDFNFYSASDEIASRYFYDDHSSFLYLRTDLLKRYLKATKLSLIWIDISSKYGAFGEHNPSYNPSFADDYRVRSFNP